ncbi:hypothetical protein ACHAXT_011951 [Thalassiosira profunda]
MKLASLAAVAASAAAAEEAPIGRSRQNRRLAGVTTSDLEQTTRLFVETNLGTNKINGEASISSSGKKRALRTSSTRQWRGGKGGKGKSDKGSGKSGKWSDDGWGHEELFYMLPAACPNECLSSDADANHEMSDVLKPCTEDDSQLWLVQSDGSYVMIESYHKPGMCIAVEYEKGDDEAMLAETCYNGQLFLKDCHSDYGTEWYFTGGQLVNSLCWAAGLSSMMTVFLEQDSSNDSDLQECEKDLAVWGANDEAVMVADTFMFVNHLPESPFYIEDVDEALGKKVSQSNKMIDYAGNA